MSGSKPSDTPLSTDGFMQRVKLALVMAFVAMGIFSVAAYATVDQLITFGSNIVAAKRDQVALEHVHSSLSSARVAIREYLVSGHPTDLQRYEQSRERLRQSLVDLRATGLPEQMELESVAEQAIQKVRKVIAVRDAEGVEPAFESIRSDGLRADTLKLTQLLQTALVREQRRWFAINERAPSVWANWLIGAAVVLLASLLGWGVYLVRQYGRYAAASGARLEYAERVGRTITSNMADGLVIVTPDSLVSEVNEAALALFGYERREIVGQPLFKLLGGTPDALAVWELVEDGLGKDDAFRLTGLPASGVTSAGDCVRLRVSANDLSLQGQRQVAVLLHDMTQIAQAAAEMEAGKEQLREITDALPILIAEFDADRRFCFHNRATAVYVGKSSGEILGRPLEDVLDAEASAFHREWLDLAYQGQEVRYERTKTLPDGSVAHFRIHLTPRFADSVRKDKVVGCYALGTDITDLKRIDRMKTEFISTVSHELRTPLTSIRGSLGLISGGVAGQLPPQVAKLVDIAKSNSERLIRLINDILDSEKIESGKIALRLQRHDLAQQVRQSLLAIDGFGRQHGVSAVLQGESPPATVWVDSDRLAQVMANLLSNAIKFSPTGGEVQVRLQVAQEIARVEVSDRGPGIPPEFQPRLFDKFSQADASDTRLKGGTGLGLNISKSLVEKMGGRIGFSSTPGQGTTFYIELPLAAATAPAAPPPLRIEGDAQAGGSAGPQAAANGPCLLHLEDDMDIQQIVATAAQDCVECVPATTLEEARVRLRQRKFDLILLDLDLHGSSGWDLLDDLEGMECKPPVVVFSATDGEPPPGRSVAAMLVKARTTEADLVEVIRATIPRQSTLVLCSPQEI